MGDFRKYYFVESIKMTSIKHIQDMTVTELMVFLGDNFSNKNFEITEKVDGSNFAIGIDNKGVFGKSKNGKPIYNPNEFDRFKDLAEDVFPAMKRLLINVKSDFKKWYYDLIKINEKELKKFTNDKNIYLTIFGEIFGSSQMNTIAYSPNVIGDGAFVVFGIKISNNNNWKDISTSKVGIKIMKKFVRDFNKKGKWNVYYKKNVSLNLDTKFLKELSNFLKDNINIITNRKRDSKSLMNKIKTKEKLKNILITYKKGLMKQIKKIPSFLGAKEIEGLVIRNIKTGGITKIVDIDKFTELNIKNWEGRKEVKEERNRLFDRIIKEVIKSADIFLLNKKQSQKIIDYLELSGKTRFNDLDELLDVLYQDAEKEVRFDTAKVMVRKMNIILDDYLKDIEKIKKNITKKQNKEETKIDDKNFSLTIKAIDLEEKEIKKLKKELKDLLNNNKNPYIKLIEFILGSKTIDHLSTKFIKK